MSAFSEKIRAFESWCTQLVPKSGDSTFHLDRITDRLRLQEKPIPDADAIISKELEQELTKMTGSSSSCLQLEGGSRIFSLSVNLPAAPLKAPQPGTAGALAPSIRLRVPTKEFAIAGGSLQEILIEVQSQRVSLRDCHLARLEVRPGLTCPVLELTNCWIGQLVLGANAIVNLTVERGAIFHLACPAPGSTNPFSGTVVLDANAYWPISRRRSRLFEGPQPYRNLRAHLEQLDNIPAANLMRRLQLRSEREDDQGVSWFVSWIYGTFANYGTAPGRPLLYAVFLYAITFAVIYAFDGGAPGQPDYLYSGFDRLLIDPLHGDVYRSLMLPLQSITNPFGLLSVRKLVVPMSGFGAILLGVQGLATALLLFLCALSIRRRFKVQ